MIRKLEPNYAPLAGEISVPGDKSISHRAVMFGAMAAGITKITNFLDGEDCLRTLEAFRAMGVSIQKQETDITIHGKGIKHLKEPHDPIDLGNSGTTTRLLLGILSGLPFHTTLFGDESLSKRPMDRVAVPLRSMGAKIDGREHGKYLPLAVRGGDLTSIVYQTPIKSAQVKSAILLAGLLADGQTTVKEKTVTRDHTENMIQAFGGVIEKNDDAISIKGKQSLTGTDIHVPGDISSAAFFLVAAAMRQESVVTIKDVGINPTRTGILDVLEQMGADIKMEEKRAIGGEPIGDITVKGSRLHGVEIGGDIIPRLIDEIPILALLASQASGTTVIKDAEELRYKETDRIQVVVHTLSQLGINIKATEDGMIVEGNQKVIGGEVDSYGDHRIGMMIAIASLVSTNPIILHNPSCIAVSYPAFFDDLEQILSISS
ncbi:3-phosphoshikimate 1-carboxyvinyltransferase [Aquibacillus sp. 3ASR75-11]|uniref:3-phosphoshikimate 1-carboxyvinyltransferase n=1 Tax=Terrihalobacillus insolitus TaxID=2950438 RepID=A0A9X3WUD6_9BACI|nr:3-phosphoshikimate 1-carboxyvinyltransferase [Terrihalobacillus insolitus]MDC3424788.1 3-phosphoshikimate 1-carboxyvinyltransferase [Terrihalobacillus insolitus]